METKINASIEQLVPKIVKEKTYLCISHGISSVNNKINKVDAHLSRMIAFSLYEQYPIWSIGWSFRSLKKYIKLDTKSVGFAEYTDFITFIQKSILESAIHSFNKKIKAIDNQAYFAVLQEEADKNLLLEILKISDYGNYCKNLNYQKDYKEKLSNLLGKLKHEKIIVYQLETRTPLFYLKYQLLVFYII